MKYLILAVTLSVSALCCASAPEPEANPRMGLIDLFNKLDREGRGGSHLAASSHVQTHAIETINSTAVTSGSGWLRWPVLSVEVTSPYGRRGRDFHEGLDLRASSGTAVYAAQSGKVIYSGRKIRGYGNLVVLRHSNGFSTVYAHNSKLLVIKGQNIKQGQLIAYSGATGRVSGPHVHFEVRKGVAAVDPMLYLNSSRSIASAGAKSVKFAKSHRQAADVSTTEYDE